MKQISRRRRRIDVILLVVVLLVAELTVKNAVAISDWWHSVVYRPPAAVVQLANDAGMNSEGKKLFYRFSPQIVDANTLRDKCGTDKLGCTSGRSIYVLQAHNKLEYASNVVTAAHEMLHVAYSRLTSSQKQALTAETDKALAESTDPVVRSIREQLSTYSAEDYYNEAHSYIGSELGDAGPELNTYYMRYFSDRSKTTDQYLLSTGSAGD